VSQSSVLPQTMVLDAEPQCHRSARPPAQEVLASYPIQQGAEMFNCSTREQCERFQMMHFGISCATCERWDEECPWHRQDDDEMAPADQVAITFKAA
jgi:hypothetical protein